MVYRKKTTLIAKYDNKTNNDNSNIDNSGNIDNNILNSLWIIKYFNNNEFSYYDEWLVYQILYQNIY